MASFAEVVDAGGFSAAAARLACSRAVVSKRVAALEREFGLTLLHRTTRRQSLTEAGQALYAHCRRVLDEVANAKIRLEEFSSTPRGTLRVSAPYGYGTRVLGPQIASFLQRYPDIRMELQLSDRLADLAGSAFDIAVRLTNEPAQGLVARKLSAVPYVVCAAPRYLERHGVPRAPNDLLSHNCLYYAGDIIQDAWHFTGLGAEFTISVAGRLVVNSIDVLRQAALDGLGVIAASRYLVEEDLARGDLVSVLEDFHLPERSVFLVTLPDRLLPPKTRAFIDFLWSRKSG